MNVVTDDELVAEDDFFVSVSEHDHRKFLPATSADVFRKADRLAEAVRDWEQGRGRKNVWETLSKASGVSYHPDGLLYDAELRVFLDPCEQIMFDGMHVLFSNGVCQLETGLALQHLVNTPDWDYNDFREFVKADFRCPKAGASHGDWATRAKAVASQREDALRRKGAFPCTASEMTLILPVFLHYLQVVVSKKWEVGDILASYEALSDVCRLFKDCKQGRRGGSQALRQASAKHLRLFNTAYGKDNAIPKHHYEQHLGDGRFQRTLDCFAGERKNHELKSCAEFHKSGIAFDRQVLLRAITSQLGDLNNDSLYGDQLYSG